MIQTKIKSLILGLSMLFSASMFANNYNISVNNDMLKFERLQDYKKVMIDFSNEERTEMVTFITQNMTFSRLANYTTTETYRKLNDSFLENLINANGFIQIENLIYRVDVSNGKCAVVKTNDYSSLVDQLNAGIYTDPKIRAYEITDDVIGMIENNVLPENARIFCGESGAGGDKMEKSVNLNEPNSTIACNWMDGEVKYVHAGIYFHLLSRVRNLCPERVIFWHKTPVSFKVKCGAWTPASYQWDIPAIAPASSTYMYDHWYFNVQPLHAYWLRIVYMAKDKDFIPNPDNPSIDLEIRKNM